MNNFNKVDKEAVELKVITKKERVNLVNHDPKVKDDSVIELTGKKTTIDITVEKVSLEILGHRVDNKEATAVQLYCRSCDPIVASTSDNFSSTIFPKILIQL